MKNDSTRKPKVTPARGRALAPETSDNSGANATVSGELLPPSSDSRALTPDLGRIEAHLFVRDNGFEMTYVDGQGFVRDIDLAREVIGLAKPRNIRERIRSMLVKGELRSDQVIAVMDDDVQVFYVDQEGSTALAFRSNKMNPETIARRMFNVHSLFSDRQRSHTPSMNLEKALSGYSRTIQYMSKKDSVRQAKLAMIPLLEKYARAAGIQMPDLSELIGPAQPRLEGV